jgi:histidinol-phosphate/aromatic aminotransferase/cobyric acid decarboxylase-like protein
VLTVTAERERILSSLPQGVSGSPSQANVVWLQAEGVDGAELAGRMARSGVVVRAGGPLGDARMIRAAVHDRESTDRFMRALEQSAGA